MNRFLTLSLASCLAMTWSLSDAAPAVKPYSYNMKITVTRPKGSVAEASFKDKTKPSSTALTPCDPDWKQDVFSFTLLYDAGARKYDKKTSALISTVADVYFFFYNPDALGLKPGAGSNDPDDLDDEYPERCELDEDTFQACDPKLYVLDRPAALTQALAMRPLADWEAIRVGDENHIYLLKDENLGTGKINDTMLRSYMRFDDLKQGLWSLIGVIGPKIGSDPTPALDFSNPSTWAAWDVTTFMLGSPWANGKVCD